MLHILCALKCEAAPLLEHFRLAPECATGKTRIHVNREAAVSLAISGIGKAAAAAAVRRTRDHFQADHHHRWLNIGIAGHASLPLGTPVLARFIRDGASDRSWYPRLDGIGGIASCGLRTLARGSTQYTGDMFDMEAAGFFAALDGCALPGQVQCLKIISDNAGAPATRIPAAAVTRLIAGKLEVIESLVGYLRQPSPGTEAVQ